MTHKSPLIIQVDPQDLDAQGVLCCPSPLAHMQVYNTHPRVYLNVAHTGQAQCPYCSTVYQLRTTAPAPSTTANAS